MNRKYTLRPYLWAYKWHYAIGIFVLLAVDLANLYIPQFIGEIIDGITDEFGYPEDVARRFHQDMTYFSYGMAILANTGHLRLSEPELREALRRQFQALTSIYGKPAKLPQFPVKAGVVL